MQSLQTHLLKGARGYRQSPLVPVGTASCRVVVQHKDEITPCTNGSLDPALCGVCP